MTPTGRAPAEGERLIRLGIGAFLATCVVLFAVAWLLGPAEATVEGHPVAEVARARADGTRQVTLDTSDPERWVPFSLELGRVPPPGPAADLYLRRHQLRAPRGALDLGPVPLSEARLPPEPAWVDGPGGHQPHPVLSGWYDYSYWTHLLQPRDATFAVRLREGAALVRVAGYYCADGERSGCLTLRYRLVE